MPYTALARFIDAGSGSFIIKLNTRAEVSQSSTVSQVRQACPRPAHPRPDECATHSRCPRFTAMELILSNVPVPPSCSSRVQGRRCGTTAHTPMHVCEAWALRQPPSVCHAAPCVCSLVRMLRLALLARATDRRARIPSSQTTIFGSAVGYILRTAQIHALCAVPRRPRTERRIRMPPVCPRGKPQVVESHISSVV